MNHSCGWLFNETKLVNPFFSLLDSEFAHKLAVSAAARGWVPREKRPDPSVLGLEVWVINVSSPNTPGLCMLQGRKQLKDLVKKVQAARDEMQWGEEGPPPLLVKIAPDLSKEDLEDIAAVSLALRLDGLVCLVPIKNSIWFYF
ncbi:hypothetical protein NC653_019075 [Populus alba x Populus x berolinensis]|uniref:Dihydroorotate dehydrogenase catalytic domain-containing protein n=1 Tax=Populus alba x Populus x berolinensis TaxID=444605 RepID=A0AAD6QHX6_9ROSI|nr:hypothetical protein NC653_019075 [Populus alba x Populus x berolinensis]